MKITNEPFYKMRGTLALINKCIYSATSIKVKEAADELKIKLLIDEVKNKSN